MYLVNILLKKAFYVTHLFMEQLYKLHSPTPHTPNVFFLYFVYFQIKINKEDCFALKSFWINTQTHAELSKLNGESISLGSLYIS